MCQFFSFCTDEYGKKYYFDWTARKAAIKAGDANGMDSHDHITAHYKLGNSVNKYEFNPLTREFTIDQINTIDDSAQAHDWVEALDFGKIVKPLIVKPIVNPLALPFVNKPSEEQIALLKEWASIVASVWDLVWDSVGDSVWNLVWDSVVASVGASVGDSVGASVGGLAGAYISSFFDIKYKHDFSSAIKLWEEGLVPSFDGTTWRLHSGKKAEIVYEWTPG